MIPKAASLILAHDADAEIKGLDAFKDHPPVAPVFWSFRIMVGMGVLMLLLAWTGTLVLRKRTPRWLLWAFAGFTFSGWVATLAGWMVTEIGRQPWLVTGILRTADAVGEASGAELGASMTGYVLTYGALLISYMVVLTHLSGKGRNEALMIDLPIVFTVLMGAAILAYVVLDGYDLGVGMLMPAASRDEQNRMVASIGPFWDANETWLVLGIGLLLVAFPAAHGEILGALYLPVAAMLVGPDAARRRLRAAHQGRRLAPRAVELAVLGRLDAREPRAGLHARALHHRLRARHRLLAVRAGGRRRPVRRLCAARRDLARAPHRRPAAGQGDRLGRGGACSGSRSASRW
jgi:hypothetical protein